MSSFVLCETAGHTLMTSGVTLYPDTVSISRRDTCNETEIVGGGIELSTNGSHGLEIIAEGSFDPEDKSVLQTLIENFVSDTQEVRIDDRNYGAVILLEGRLTEKPGEVGGHYRLRFGGYEI